jgi:hypothetical protein
MQSIAEDFVRGKHELRDDEHSEHRPSPHETDKKLQARPARISRRSKNPTRGSNTIFAVVPVGVASIVMACGACSIGNPPNA